MSDEKPKDEPAAEPVAASEATARDEPAAEGKPVQASDGDEGPPIVDPMVGAIVGESEVVFLEGFAARVGFLGKTSLAVGALAFVLALVSFTGRVDIGVLLYVAPVGAANVALGVLLGRAAATLTEVAKTRYENRASLLSALRELHKVFGVQLLLSGFLVFLLLVALLIAATLQRATEI